MRKRSVLIVGALVLMCCASAWAQQTTYGDVMARFSRSATNRSLVSKDVVLILDETARQLIVRHQERPLTVGYDDIERIVFDVSTHKRGGWAALLAPGAIGDAIGNSQVQEYWCYIEYKGTDGATQQYMLVIPKKASSAFIAKMQTLLGAKVTVARFDERGEEIKKKTLPDVGSKHDLKTDKVNRPMPEVKPGLALIVAVCPSVSIQVSPQYKIHANDRVVLVNKEGSYGFAYLEPGEYLLASQFINAHGFRMKLEAGQAYYFLQDTVGEGTTALSRHTKELVMYELSGAAYADWKRK